MSTDDRQGDLVRFVAGGTVSPSSRAYVTRPFEQELFRHLTNAEWVLLLGPRQHGKSSALVRLYGSLQDSGLTCAFIDLQRFGSREASYAEFLAWLASEIASEVGVEESAPPHRAREDLESWLEPVLPARFANIAVMIDEASAVPARHRDRFFSQLRALYNRRALSTGDALPLRVVFVFAGTFRPETMIESDNSPFNVSKWVSTSDFEVADVKQLAAGGLGERLAAYGERAFALVGGQPYLVQTLLAAVQRSADDPEGAYEGAVDDIESGADRHVPDLVRLVREDRPLLDVAMSMTRQGIEYNGVDDTHAYAVVAGIARRAGRTLAFRNPLYEAALTRLAADGVDADRPAGSRDVRFDVLLVTATEVETAVVCEVFSALGDTTFHKGANTYRDLGSHGGARVALVRAPEMGAGGVGGAALTTSEAVRALGPSAVIMVGIAFGVDPESQQIGEVLCSTRIVDYEQVRVGSSDDVDRGVMATPPPAILGRFQNAKIGYDGRVEFGLMVTGAKLIDNQEFRDELVRRYPDARGGEMEALGVCAVCERENVDWLIAKAYCDWADGNKRENKARDQRLAAERAAQFVRHTLSLGGFGSP